MIAANAPLLYLALRQSAEPQVLDWLEALTVVGGAFANQVTKQCRSGSARHPGHRSFTVLRHPVDRAMTLSAGNIIEKPATLTARNADKRYKDGRLPREREILSLMHSRAFRLSAFLSQGMTATAIELDQAVGAPKRKAGKGFERVLPARTGSIREDELQQELQAAASRRFGVRPAR